MSEPQPLQCARAGCTNRVPDKGKRGPAHRYCSNACKHAAYRDRRSARRWAPDIDASLLHLPASLPPDEQVGKAVVEFAMVIATFGRLSTEASPFLAARCEHLYDVMRSALENALGAAV